MTLLKELSINKKIALGALLFVSIGVVLYAIYRPPALIEIDLFIPINRDSASKSIRVISPNPAGLDVRVKGTQRDIALLSQYSTEYRLQFPKNSKGVETVAIEANRIHLPKGIIIVQIHPRMITVRIEERTEKKLPIKAIFSGTPATGYTVASTIVTPRSVGVVGPESILSELVHIPTKPLNISGLVSPYKSPVILDLPDGVDAAAETPVFIEVTFKKRLKVKTLSGIKIKGRGTQKPYRISPPVLNLTIEGPDQVVENLTSDPTFNVYVDLRGLGVGVFVRRATILLPLNTTLIRATPEVFTVHIGSGFEQEG